VPGTARWPAPSRLFRPALSGRTKRDTIARVSDAEGQQLVVRISGRDQPEKIAVPDSESVRDELARFLNRQGPYAQMWIRLASGEYIRYDAIESISLP
jgi:hypothetical protein